MKDIGTYLAAGWDFVGEWANGVHEVWQMPQAGGYPILAILNGYTPPVLQGLGTAESPYLITSASDLGAVLHYSPNACYRLAATLDLAGIRWGSAVIPEFAGTFDGNGMTIAHLTLQGNDTLGLFGTASGSIQDLHLTDANVIGVGDSIGSLAGSNAGSVARCTAAGVVGGRSLVGGLIGINAGSVVESAFAGSASGTRVVGGLVGENGNGSVFCCSSRGQPAGDGSIGGLAGDNRGALTDCYSTASAFGTGLDVAGLAGSNYGTVLRCYSAGLVSGGPWNHGGLVVSNGSRGVKDSFWDIQASGQTTSDGGTGLTTVKMQSASTFTNAGWGFNDTWTICEGKDYPRLKWEQATCSGQ